MGNKKAQTKNHKWFGAIVMLVLCVSVVLGATIFYPVSEPTGNTENSSVEIESNFTEANLKEVKFHWNGTNFTIYDTDNLVLAYNFNNLSSLGENDTHVFDISGNGNNGTIIGGENITWDSTGRGIGNYDGAYNWSGNKNGKIQTDNLGFNDTISISMWFNRASGERLIESDSATGGFSIINSGSNTFTFRVANATGFDSDLKSTAFSQDVWHHIVVVYNGSSQFIYKNGELDLQNDSVGIGRFKHGDNSVLVGNTISGNNPLTGRIDEVRIWNKSLSASEIQEIYRLNLKKFDSNSWSFYSNQSMTVNTTGYSHNYYLCATNSTDSENCTSINTITRIPEAITIISNFTNSIGDIRDDFYGVANYRKLFSENGTWLSSLSAYNNHTWNRETFLDSNMGMTRQRVFMDEIFSNDTELFDVKIANASELKKIADEIEWANNNNNTVLIDIINMPEFLQNRSSGYCNSTAWETCPPNNLTASDNMILLLLSNITNNGEYKNLAVEVGNEPYLHFWLNNLSTDNITKATEYVKWYNSTYNAIKNNATLSYISVGGASGDMFYSNLITTFLSNASSMGYDWDFVSIHAYSENVDDSGVDVTNDLEQYTDTVLLLGNCTTYSVDCSRIIISEWSSGSIDMERNRSQDDKIASFFADSYQSILNTYPENVSLVTWFWGDLEPSHFSQVMQPGFSTAFYPNITSKYNTTKNFATYHSAGSTVYTSTSSSSAVKTVSSKKGNDNYITIINTDTEARNITLSDLPDEVHQLVDEETSTTYSVSSNSASLGVLDSYEIMYLSFTPVAITVINPIFQEDEKTQPINLVITTDESATCEYSMDSNSRISMGTGTSFDVGVVLSNGVHSVEFICTDAEGNEATKVTNFEVHLTSENDDTDGSEGSDGIIPDEEEILGAGADSTPLIIRNDTIISSEEISLDSIGVKVGDWFYGYENEITALTYDSENNLVEVDSIDFEILGDTLYTKDIVRDKTGKYTASLFLLTEADTVTVEITAIQGSKTSKVQQEISLVTPTKSQETIRRAGNILERAVDWAINNKMEVGLGILIILVVFITMFIFSDNKKK